MEIKSYSRNKLGTNSYIISKGNRCIVIDPCVSYDELFKDSNMKIEVVFITHAHFDHIDQLDTYLDKALCFYMHEKAYPKLKDPDQNFSSMTGFKKSYNLCCEQTMFIDEGDDISFLDEDITILYTPGHSDCSISILINNHLFGGDLIFKGSVGRFDLPTSSYDDLLVSLKKVNDLTGDIIIYPGHGPVTTLIEERQKNSFFRGL